MTERVLGPTGSPRHRAWLTTALVALAAVVVFGITAAVGAALTGSNFEIDANANLKVDGASPAIDWASVPPCSATVLTDCEVRVQDTDSGSTDESFGQGAKEDTAVPSVVDGSIPPNKSDLKFFGVYQEGTSSAGFLNMFWSRVQDPSGTTNMDFEFNKLQCSRSTPVTPPTDADCSANGYTPTRSENDILVIYDLSNGGTVPTFSIRKWTAAGEWGPATPLSLSTQAAGSINTSAILAPDSDGLGSQSARTFGEAQIAMTALFPPGSGCTSFGSAYLKSRSSDSFTSALKDFVPPVGVNITNCGSLRVLKKDASGNALAGAQFKIYKDDGDSTFEPSDGAAGTKHDILQKSCTTTTTSSPPGMGDCTLNNLEINGKYWVFEAQAPSGYVIPASQTNPTLVTITSSGEHTAEFTNNPALGDLKVVKDDDANNLMNNVRFTLTGTSTTGTSVSLSCRTGVSNSSGSATPAAGECSFLNVPVGSNYTLAEDTSTLPAGYSAGTITNPVSVTSGGLTTVNVENPRTHKVIVIVCHEGTNTLAATAVQKFPVTSDTVPNPLTSLGTLTGAGLPTGTTQAQICGLPGFGGLTHTNEDFKVRLSGISH